MLVLTITQRLRKEIQSFRSWKCLSSIWSDSPRDVSKLITKDHVFAIERIMNSFPTSSALLRLKQVYGGTSSFQWVPSRGDLIEPSFQQQVIEQMLLSDHFSAFPPSIGRRRMFWKWFIQLLEGQGEEVDERIYSAYVALLSESQRALTGLAPPPPSYSTRFWKQNAKVDGTLYLTTILESQTTIESGTTGLRTWNASLALADWLITHSVEHRNVLELGSGAGFLGLIIAQLQLNYQNAQPKDTLTSLMLSDGNSEVLNRCHQNFLLSCNNMCKHHMLYFTLLEWSDALDQAIMDNRFSKLNQTLQNADVVIGADLEKARKDCFALLALTVRRKETIDTFIQNLGEHKILLEQHLTSMPPFQSTTP
ncbi:hypothetical protein Clacol_004140 [Clathrus columnatus]|uniref:Protein-lysine N-methyltransferase EEF2KMT n=1 Tax=Clathrus columnatus TaxID=1419009 RepID=A0AAV5A5J4_9AGAM|nr:hypothetical protein Clacol_004140 [Clathrus columnatus]